MKLTIDRTSLAHDLRAIGLRRGDVVLVHSSYRSLGIKNPETLIQALIQLVDDSGTQALHQQALAQLKRDPFFFVEQDTQ